MVNFFVKETPLRRQNDPLECGAVCLGIVLEALGHYESSKTLREACLTSRNGSKAKDIVDAAQHFSLDAHAKKILASDLKKLKHLAILFFDACHFVVFEGYFAKRYYINDPAFGRYALLEKDFRRRYNNVAIILIPTASLLVKKSPSLQRKLSIKNSLIMQLVGFGSGLLFSLVSLSLGHILSQEVNWSWIIGVVAIIMSTAPLTLWIFWQEIYNSSVKISSTEMTSLKQGWLATPLDFFADVDVGKSKNIFVTSFDRALLLAKKTATRNFFVGYVTAIFIAICAISPLIGILLFILTVIINSIDKVIKTMEQKNTDDPKLLFQTLRNAFQLKAMGQINTLIANLMIKEKSFLIREAKKYNLYTPALVAVSVGIFFLLLEIVFWATNQQFGWTEIYSVLILSYGFGLGIHEIFSQLAKDEVFESMSYRQELASHDQAYVEQVSNDHRLLELKNVSFKYRGENQAVWHDLNLTIMRGQIIGVVGKSLVGKSTLFRLLNNKLRPNLGEVVHFTKKSSLRIIGIDDDLDLMDASLKDNLTLFDPRISEEKMVDALKNAMAIDLFYNKPMGLLFHIVAQGKNLSITEKRRLLIAQALLKDPDLIILDDVFDYLDEPTSLALIKNLSAKNITVIFNSFRINELRKTDEIFFIEQPGVLIQGHHDDLISRPNYKSLLEAGNII